MSDTFNSHNPQRINKCTDWIEMSNIPTQFKKKIKIFSFVADINDYRPYLRYKESGMSSQRRFMRGQMSFGLKIGF